MVLETTNCKECARKELLIQVTSASDSAIHCGGCKQRASKEMEILVDKKVEIIREKMGIHKSPTGRSKTLQKDQERR